jgi:MoaA/NifB/PqqE/SkfB family radical SAM enzyme
MRDADRGQNTSDTRPIEKSFCRAAFDNLHIAIGGDAKPCCEFKDTIGNARSETVVEIWNGKSLADFRARMLSGERDKRCWKCWKAEDAGSNSLRQMFNSHGPMPLDGNAETLAAALPRRLDLRFSNLCNLSCRTCGPACSSKWYSEAKITEWWKTPAPSALDETFSSTSEALEKLGPTLDQVEDIYFAGGEPLLHEGHYGVLRELIARARTDVNLVYNTNVTELRLGGSEVLPLWSHFKDVLVLASIDGHKELGELVREGLSWDRFVRNIQTIRDACPHVRLVFSITVSVLNIFALPELCEHLQAIDPNRVPEFHFNVLQEPQRYSIQILPRELKEEAARRLELFAQEYSLTPAGAQVPMKDMIRPVINFMMFEDKTNKLAQFRARTLQLDQMRDRNTAHVIPELARVLHEPLTSKYLRQAKESFGAFAHSLRRLSPKES